MRFLDLGGGSPVGSFMFQGRSYDYRDTFTPTPEGPQWTSVNITARHQPDIVACASDLPFPDRMFDHVRMMCFPSSSLSKRVLAEVSRVLTPGGFVYLQTGKSIKKHYPAFGSDARKIFKSVCQPVVGRQVFLMYT